MSVADRVLAVARSQIGYVEQGGPHGNDGNITKYWDWWDAETDEHDDGMSWCGCEVSWVYDQAGARLDTADRHNGPGFIYCPDAEQHYRSTGRTVDPAHAVPADIILFHFPGEPNEANHTGILESFDLRNVTTIDGNTSADDAGSQSNGGQVARRTRPWSQVRAICHPPQLDLQPSPQEEDMAITLPITVTVKAGQVRGFASVDGVKLDTVRGTVARVESAGAMKGVVPGFGIDWGANPVGDAVVWGQLNSAPLIDVDLHVQIVHA